MSSIRNWNPRNHFVSLKKITWSKQFDLLHVSIPMTLQHKKEIFWERDKLHFADVLFFRRPHSNNRKELETKERGCVSHTICTIQVLHFLDDSLSLSHSLQQQQIASIISFLDGPDVRSWRHDPTVERPSPKAPCHRSTSAHSITISFLFISFYYYLISFFCWTSYHSTWLEGKDTLQQS